MGGSAALEVLKQVRRRALKRFSFDWTIVGDDTPPPVDPSKPNVLTFPSVDEEDLDYYKCEVKEAGKVVLTVYRALYKDESTIQKSKFSLLATGLYLHCILMHACVRRNQA